MGNSNFINDRVQILTVIASYGDKNNKFLKKVIQNYQEMEMNIDVVVISEAPKNLGDEIEVVIGLPSRDPWSLPFAHKRIFADRIDQYDLFIYSEDDIGVNQSNIIAFQRATAYLNSDEIAGFIRYEIGENGIKFMPDFYGGYHWKANSPRKRGDYIVAEANNEHAGFYILTREQLRRAIDSGGFLRKPHEGKYDMACTAATDPYTSCGFHKAICISNIDEFLVHHLSNRYANRIGISMSDFQLQIQIMKNISDGKHPAKSLCNTESKILHGKWSKSYYEEPSDEIMSVIPERAKSFLSIGCGWGVTERRIMERGAEVVGIPLDSVIGAVAESLNIKILYGTLNEALKSLKGKKYDCVLMTNLLHLLPDPLNFIEDCSEFVSQGGSLILAGPNFEFIPHLMKRLFVGGDYDKLKSYRESGISVFSIQKLKRRLSKAGLQVTAVLWDNWISPLTATTGILPKFGRYLARDWALIAKR